MPLESARSQMQTAPDLVLPPPFTLVRLRELGDAFVHAQSIAEKQGAGTLVYVGRFDLVEFALVLEPDEPLWQARHAPLARRRPAVPPAPHDWIPHRHGALPCWSRPSLPSPGGHQSVPSPTTL